MMQAQALTLVFHQFTQISNANAYTMCVNRLKFRKNHTLVKPPFKSSHPQEIARSRDHLIEVDRLKEMIRIYRIHEQN